MFLLVCLVLGLGEPEYLVLVDGRQVPIGGQVRVGERLVSFCDRSGHWLSLPRDLVDVAATFREPDPPPAQPPPRPSRRRVPWQHRAFRDKTSSLHRVQLTSEGLRTFTESHPRSGISRAAPEREPPPEPAKDEEAGQETENEP